MLRPILHLRVTCRGRTGACPFASGGLQGLLQGWQVMISSKRPFLGGAVQSLLCLLVAGQLDKGLELSWEGKACVALEGGGVLEEWKPDIAMPRKKASLQWAGTTSCSDNPDEGSEFYMNTLYVTALTRRVCHRQGCIGSVGIGRKACRYVLMGS